MARNIKEYGPWAIITGASSGIGAGFARRLVHEGLHVVLVGRRRPALNELATELQAHGAQTRVVVQDLAEPGAAQAVLDATEDLDVGVLVSNAGAGRMGGFLQNDAAALRSMLALNVIAQMELSHGFTTRLRRSGRHGGLLLVSSTAALQPVALGANYSAAKAYILNLGESLNAELRPLGIDVTVLVPGPTNTPGLNARDDIDMGSLPVPAMSVDAVVGEGLDALRRHRPRRVAGLVNRWMARLTPRALGGKIFGGMMGRIAPPRLRASAPLALPAGDVPQIRAVG